MTGTIKLSITDAHTWFSLAHKHKDIHMHRMAYLTQFLIPALLNPMINKVADEDDVLVLMSAPFSLIKATT